MELLKIIIPALIAVIALFDERLKLMNKTIYKFVLLSLILTMLSIGIYEINNKNATSNERKNIINTMISNACSQIVGSIIWYGVIREEVGDSIASEIANNGIVSGGKMIDKLIPIINDQLNSDQILAASNLVNKTTLFPYCCDKAYILEIDSLISILDNTNRIRLSEMNFTKQ